MTTNWNTIADTINFTLEPAIQDSILQLHSDSRILDFGCGYGRISDTLWKKGYKNLVAYDSSQGMIERGKREFPSLNLKVLQSDTIPEKTESFDAIIMCATLTCIPCKQKRAQVISELFRVLKVNGIINIFEFERVKGKSYSKHGEFKSSFGVTMKHFRESELENELKCFTKQETNTVHSKTLTGSPAEVISYYGTKQ